MTRGPRTILLLSALVIALAPAAGCGTLRDVVVPREVKVQVPVPCIDPADVPRRPATRSEADLLAMDAYRRTLAAWSDLKRLEAYAAELEAVVAACARMPPAKPP